MANQHEGLLEKLTVIIPTYNRPHYLQRLITYYAKKKLPIHFLVLDSSTEVHKQNNRKNCAVFSNQIEYLEFPNDISVPQKLLLGLQHGEREYSAFCADDDLVFINGLTQSLSFLNDHHDYVCVDGIYLNFNPVHTDINLMIEYATRGIDGEDAGSRVFRLYQKYESLFYGVFRTQDAVKIFTGVSQNKSLHFQELFQATAALILGKSHRLPLFYAARQHCEPAQGERDKWQTYYWFADDPNEFMTHYLHYRQFLWNFYQQHVKMSYTQDIFLKIMDVTHAMYFGLGCPPAYFHSALQSNCWPNASFQKANQVENNICNALKSKRRIWLEIALENMIKYLPKIILSYHSILDVKKLNRKIAKSQKTEWKCKLGRGLGWLASVEDFKKSYQELCLYLDSK